MVSHIKPFAKQTTRTGVLGNIGGFGGLFDTKAAGYKDPLLVSGTDGVGTKLKVSYWNIDILNKLVLYWYWSLLKHLVTDQYICNIQSD